MRRMASILDCDVVPAQVGDWLDGKRLQGRPSNGRCAALLPIDGQLGGHSGLPRRPILRGGAATERMALAPAAPVPSVPAVPSGPAPGAGPLSPAGTDPGRATATGWQTAPAAAAAASDDAYAKTGDVAGAECVLARGGMRGPAGPEARGAGRAAACGGRG